jgi:hypothetical protein
VFLHDYCSDESERQLVRENQRELFPRGAKFYMAEKSDCCAQLMPSTGLWRGRVREATAERRHGRRRG